MRNFYLRIVSEWWSLLSIEIWPFMYVVNSWIFPLYQQMLGNLFSHSCPLEIWIFYCQKGIFSLRKLLWTLLGKLELWPSFSFNFCLKFENLAVSVWWSLLFKPLASNKNCWEPGEFCRGTASGMLRFEWQLSVLEKCLPLELPIAEHY